MSITKTITWTLDEDRSSQGAYYYWQAFLNGLELGLINHPVLWINKFEEINICFPELSITMKVEDSDLKEFYEAVKQQVDLIKDEIDGIYFI